MFGGGAFASILSETSNLILPNNKQCKAEREHMFMTRSPRRCSQWLVETCAGVRNLENAHIFHARPDLIRVLAPFSPSCAGATSQRHRRRRLPPPTSALWPGCCLPRCRSAAGGQDPARSGLHRQLPPTASDSSPTAHSAGSLPQPRIPPHYKLQRRPTFARSSSPSPGARPNF